MESPRLASVPGEGRGTCRVDAVDPVVQLHLTGGLQTVKIEHSVGHLPSWTMEKLLFLAMQ